MSRSCRLGADLHGVWRVQELRWQCAVSPGTLKHPVLNDAHLACRLAQGGNIGFFQALCLLGYCLFPIDIAAVVSVLVHLRIVR